MAKSLWDLGVSAVYLGYPYFISQDKGNKLTSNLVFSQVGALANKLHEHGVKTYLVVEYNTSRFCAYHNANVTRRPRGVVNCPLGHKLHSDVSGALNIVKLGVKKIVDALALSFLFTSRGISLKGE
ncbi:MAG: zinc ribbon domain-containing protein [Candidatus Aramenus sp.]|nr:zinc ribbon domain-containing protein [Candidatus Aramenus sp.]